MRKTLFALLAASSFLACKRPQKQAPARPPIAVVKGTLTWDDLDAVTHAPAVRAAAPFVAKSFMLTADDANWRTAVRGTTPSYFEVCDWPIARGEVFTDEDLASAAKVVVLGDTVAARLFENRDPLGATIRIGSMPMIVVGVAAKRGVASSGVDQDDGVFVPVTTFQKRIDVTLSQKFVGVILFSGADLAAATQSVDAVLRDRHFITPGLDPDYEIKTFSP